MSEVFRPYLRKFALVFFNDILVCNKTHEDHRFPLHAVLSHLKENQLVEKISRNTFGPSQLDYLGNVIAAQGVAADAQKIESMLLGQHPKISSP